jgi:DNA invertase Pin-like site-specific DNA recombinase
MTEAVGYCRCSGEAFDGETWDRQEAAINKYAESNGITIVEWFRDEYVPGKTEMKNRPGLAACMARVEDNCVKLVLVESADRLARDSMVSELIVREFQKSGVRVVSASGGVDLTAGDDSNPTAKLVRQILASVAEFDRCVIVLKLRAARERLRSKIGKCEGRKAYGEDNEDERETLKLMLEMRAKGFTTVHIAKRLNEINIPTRYGGKWHGATVSKILLRPRECANGSLQKGISESLSTS